MCICIYDIPEHSAAFFGDDGSTTIMPSFLRARWPPLPSIRPVLVHSTPSLFPLQATTTIYRHTSSSI